MAKDDAQPTPTEVLMGQMAMVLEKLSERQASGTSNEQMAELMIRLSASLEKIAEANLAGSKMVADETRRAHRPSNEVVPGISVFDRRGKTLPDYVKPVLRCPMLLPWLAENESLTREEVELLNLMESGAFQVKLIDNSVITVTVKVEMAIDNVTPSRMLMNHETSFNNDNFKNHKPLATTLREILKQSPNEETRRRAAAVVTDDDEADLIKAKQLSVAA